MKQGWTSLVYNIRAMTLLVLCLLQPAANAYVGTSPTELQSIVFLTDSKKFIQDWQQPANKDVPRIVTLKQAALGEQLYIGMIAYLPSSMKGNRAISVAVRVIAPDGSMLVDLPNYAMLQVELPEEGGYVLIDPPLDLNLTKSDLTGEYHAYVHIEDKLTGKKAYGDYIFSLRNI